MEHYHYRQSYVINTTDSLIMSSLQPNTIIHYTLQVIDTDTHIKRLSGSDNFVVTSSSLSSIMPTPTSSGKI